MLVLVAMVLTACGGEEGTTQVPASPPPVTADSPDDLGTVTEAATEVATQEGATTETPGVPVTGDVNPARLSNQLDFTVWSQDGEQIGEVDDMVLDLDNTRVAYVVVGTGGFLDLGERTILVPWNALELQTGTGDTTGGQPNAFVLTTELDVFRNAPDFDLANLPEAGQTAGDWDTDISTYWESGGVTGGEGTPTAEGTDAAEVTATATGEGTGTGQATATAGTGAGTDQATATAGTDTSQATATAGTGTGTDQGTGRGQALQGVVLASEVLGSTISLSPGQGTGEGTGTGTGQTTATATSSTGAGQATATPGTGTDQATATAGTGAGQATATTDAGQGAEDIQGTIDDLIVAIDPGDIQFVVVDVALDDGERWIPVPVSSIQWDAANGAFLINASSATLREAPSFENGQYPDTSMSGWNTEFDTFWQNSGGGTGAGTGTGSGGGSGTGATATPTP
jgi:sporulation protein YlmC with PRC-barrel domain